MLHSFNRHTLRRMGALAAAALLLASAGCAKPGGSTDTGALTPEAAAGAPATLSGNITRITLGDTIQIEGEGAVAEDGGVVIRQAGNYSVSGELTQGRLLVDAEKADVHLELAGVSITSPAGAAIYARQVNKLDVLLATGAQNTLSAPTAATGEETEKAALFSNAPLLLRGNGSLTINGGFKHGVASDDTLVIEGGNITVEAATDGLHCNDEMEIRGGNIAITSGSDGAESEKHLTVTNGLLRISAGDDGLHAAENLSIRGGAVQITQSTEGLEGKETITISNGAIEIVSSDDGLNAGAAINILGGSTLIRAGGDGIDSNGNLTISGGTVNVFATGRGDGALDVGDRGGTLTINGGTVLGTGVGMAVTPAAGSTQPSLWVNAAFSAGASFQLTEQGGAALAEATLPEAGQMIFFSSPLLVSGKTYEAFVDGQSVGSAALNGNSASIGSAAGGTGGGFGGGGMGAPPADFTLPEGDFTFPEGGFSRPEGESWPEGASRPTRPEGESRPQRGGFPGEGA
ncbi:MAG: carbohydrate-binding domain-containing protein [Oscillospiraceae bacterium]|nr:carbohydrate-binding domain-containing protein [Oscillospiraceae bacterium]